MARKTAGVCLALSSVLMLGSAAFSQEAAPPSPPAPSPQVQAMMEAYAKAAEPGPQHVLLAQMAGTFEATVKTWMGPGEPEVSKGLSENAMVLGGRYLYQKYTGAFLGRTFEGVGLLGYDKVTGRFQAVWIDSMSTGTMWGEGEADPSGKVLTFVNTYSDPLAGGVKKSRSIVRVVDRETHTMEMFDTGPDGKEVKVMEIVYRRK